MCVQVAFNIAEVCQLHQSVCSSPSLLPSVCLSRSHYPSFRFSVFSPSSMVRDEVVAVVVVVGCGGGVAAVPDGGGRG